MKCSFCERPLLCRACGKPFVPRGAAMHAAMYQPDMEISCPECQQVLVCKWCGFIFGADQDEDEA